MRVLHIIPSIAPAHGGPSRSVPRLVETLKGKGVDAVLAAAGGNGNAYLELEHLAIPGEVLTSQSKSSLAREIATSDLVEIHSLWNGTSTWAALTCRRQKIPYVLTPRGMLDPACISNHAFAKGLYRHLFDNVNIQRANGFHFLSDDERERAYIGRKLSQNQVAVSPNGAMPAPQNLPQGMIAKRFPSLEGRTVLLHLGRLDAIKGIDIQLEALTQFPENERPTLLLIGPDFGDEQRLRNRVAQGGLQPWVFFGGPVYGDERFALLAEANLVFLTSVYDCNPMVATETFMVGGAMLATDGCGLSAAARMGAVRLAPSDTNGFADAVRKLLADSAALSILRRRAREYAEGHLSWDTTVAPLIQLYNRLLSETRTVTEPH